MESEKRGFTLIELLVVISIIGMLSSIILASLNSARIKANQSYIDQTIKQYVLAINLMRESNNGDYFDGGQGNSLLFGFCLDPYPCSNSSPNQMPVQFNNNLLQYIGGTSLPIIQKKSANYFSVVYTGARYIPTSQCIPGPCVAYWDRPMIYWNVSSEMTCGSTGSLVATDASGNKQCRVLLPQ